MSFTSVVNTREYVIIGKELTDPWVDICSDIMPGDIIFARYPFKLFPVFEG